MKLAQPTPELPVRSVADAQDYFRDRFGFAVAWHHKEGRIGAVAHGECSIFFRETEDEIHPGTFWIFTDDVDVAFLQLSSRGADIVEPVTDKPWGLRQFSVKDLNGNLFHFHQDIDD